MSKGLMSKLRKNSSFKDGRVNVLSESKYLHEKDNTPTNIPAVNVAFSGSLNGGYTSGLTMIAGPSKHFKTAFGLIMMKAFMDKNPEGVVLFTIQNLVLHRDILMFLILTQQELFMFQ